MRNVLRSVMLLLSMTAVVSYLGIQESNAAQDVNKGKNIKPTVRETLIDGERIGEDSDIVIETGSGRLLEFPEDIGHVFISAPTIADINLLSKNSFELLGLKQGKARLRVDGKNGRVLLKKNVSVAFDLDKISSVLCEMFPSNSVSIINLEQSIVLKGEVESPKIAADIMDTVSKLTGGEANIVNNMTISMPTQVLLKVKIAKVYREITKSLGINWRNLSIGSGLSTAVIGGTRSGALPLVLAGVSKVAGKVSGGEKVTSQLTNTFDANVGLSGTESLNLPTSTAGARWIIDYKDGKGNSIGSIIDALAEESLATILAEPTLVALSGESAKFSSGGEEPYKNNSTGNSTTTTTQFKEWGIMLDFTPTVLSENRIRIKVKPEVSSLENASVVGEAKPLSKQSVETTVELGSGQSLAIAGLIKKEKSLTASELPGLAKIPVLGGLFKSSANTLKETELVILVTPYIVKPSSKQLMTPLDHAPAIFSPCGTTLFKSLCEDNENFQKNKKNKQRNAICNRKSKLQKERKSACMKAAEHSGYTIS